ncbi:MAG: hypothetical protein GY861_15695, partial [bacterium]|nr:hypothetical protein [bacterium]
MKLALAVIAKDEKEDIDRIINDYGFCFDEIAIAVDDTKCFKTLTKQYKNREKVTFYKYEWIADFSHKRNWLTEKISSDYYLRIDTDDEIINPERIRPVAEQAWANSIGIVYCMYDYSKDEWGNTNAQHYRETIIKNDTNY